jgi:hypothetical protein
VIESLAVNLIHGYKDIRVEGGRSDMYIWYRTVILTRVEEGGVSGNRWKSLYSDYFEDKTDPPMCKTMSHPLHNSQSHHLTPSIRCHALTLQHQESWDK